MKSAEVEIANNYSSSIIWRVISKQTGKYTFSHILIAPTTYILRVEQYRQEKPL